MVRGARSVGREQAATWKAFNNPRLEETLPKTLADGTGAFRLARFEPNTREILLGALRRLLAQARALEEGDHQGRGRVRHSQAHAPGRQDADSIYGPQMYELSPVGEPPRRRGAIDGLAALGAQPHDLLLVQGQPGRQLEPRLRQARRRRRAPGFLLGQGRAQGVRLLHRRQGLRARPAARQGPRHQQPPAAGPARPRGARAPLPPGLEASGGAFPQGVGRAGLGEGLQGHHRLQHRFRARAGDLPDD